MKYRALLRRNADGEERWTEWFDVDEGEAGGVEFMWTKGNYACDCNRALFFYNHGPESDDRKCGIDDFDLVRIENDAGERLCYVRTKEPYAWEESTVVWGADPAPDCLVSDTETKSSAPAP